MRRRVVIAIAAVASVAVLLLAIPLAVVVARSYRDEELLRLQRDTVEATRVIDIAPGSGDPIEVPASSDERGVYAVQGRLVAGEGPPRADSLTLEALRRGRLVDDTGDARFEVAVPLIHVERVTGVLRAVRSDDAVVERTRNAWLALAGFALGIVALAVAAAWILGKRLAAPLEQLAGSARKLGEGDFVTRAPRFSLAEPDAVGEALNTTAERLGALLAREREFSADASHQLRTPLAALRLELEAMELRPGAPPEVGSALREADRLEETIQTLLAVARDTPQSGADAPLADILQDAETRWRGPLASEGRPIRVSSPDGMTARGSPRVLAQVLEVLLDNAHRHGSGPVSVTAREVANDSIAVDVGDEGPGLEGTPEDVFARGAGSGEGHGIGLHLARSLAMAEGGKLVVTRAGPAPVFTLFLQRDRSDQRP